MTSSPAAPRRVGRYRLLQEIASGGMGTVYLGLLETGLGLSRLVAVKVVHRHLANAHDVVAMLVDEARSTMRINHANVGSVIDVVEDEGELFLVMEYLAGESLASLFARAREKKARIALPIVSAVVCDVLRGLDAAHNATDARGEPLGIVHRDISPQNVLVGAEGIARVIDFGIARATTRLQETRTGVIKGKIAYIAPEQLDGEAATPRGDLYSVAVLLWELLTLRRLYSGDDEAAVLAQIQMGLVEPPSYYASDLPVALDALVLRGLAADGADRFQTATEMLEALQEVVAPATARAVGEWVHALACDALQERAAQAAELQRLAPASAPVAPAQVRDEGGPRAFRRAAGLLAALLSLSVIALALVALRAPRPSPAPPSEATASATAARTLRTEVAALATPADRGAPIVPDEAKPPVAAAPRRPSPVRQRAAPRVSDDCVIPFRVGPDRRRIYKPECFQ